MIYYHYAELVHRQAEKYGSRNIVIMQPGNG